MSSRTMTRQSSSRSKSRSRPSGLMKYKKYGLGALGAAGLGAAGFGAYRLGKHLKAKRDAHKAAGGGLTWYKPWTWFTSKPKSGGKKKRTGISRRPKRSGMKKRTGVRRTVRR